MLERITFSSFSELSFKMVIKLVLKFMVISHHKCSICRANIRYKTLRCQLPLWTGLFPLFDSPSGPLQCWFICYEPVFVFYVLLLLLLYNSFTFHPSIGSSCTAAVINDVVKRPAFSLFTDCCHGDNNENRCKSLSAYYYWLYKKKQSLYLLCTNVN